MYGREIRGRTLTFGVSGKLYRNSLIMYDRETGSLWSHFLGAAVDGPLKGARLRFVPSVLTNWRAWRARRPDTLVLSPRLSPYGSYLDGYTGYYSSGRTGILGTRRKDTRLGDKELVLGVLAPVAKAYAFRDLERRGTVRDTLAGRPVEVVFDRGSRAAEAFLLGPEGRRRLPATPVFWFAWVDFFPGAPLWRPAGEARSRP